MSSLKNWDNQTWISSRKYIESFNNFVLKQIKLNRDSKILDIGCGRGKIVSNLYSKLRLKNKPQGIDIINHKDKDKRFKFKKIDALSFLLKNKNKFDLIMIKQTIHFFKIKEVKKILSYAYLNLNTKGIIIILSLNTSNNEIPTFSLMARKLQQSFKKEKLIKKNILKFKKEKKIKQFNFKVKVTKKKYIEMLKQRYISSLSNLNDKQILNGIKEIELKYKKIIIFCDKLSSVIFKRNTKY